MSESIGFTWLADAAGRRIEPVHPEVTEELAPGYDPATLADIAKKLTRAS